MSGPPSRIHFGSLENNLTVRSGEVPPPSTLSNTSEQETLPFSAGTLASQQRSQQVLEDFEARKRAKQLTLPTDDKLIQARLRELGEPIIYFGEQAPERRERLRDLLNRRGIDEAYPSSASASRFGVSSDVQDNELFYTEGTTALKQARMFMTKYSLVKAKERLQLAKKRREDIENSEWLNKEENRLKELYGSLSGYTLVSSQVGEDRPLSWVHFLPDGERLVTAAWNGVCKMWKAEDSSLIQTFNGHLDRASCIVSHPLSCSNQLSENSANLVSCGADKLVNIWSLSNDKPLFSLKGHQHRVNRVAFHPSGRYVGSCSVDMTWRLWDVETGKDLLEQEGHSRPIHAISFHPDGSLAATAGFDCLGRIWDIRSGKSIQVTRGHSKPVLGLEFSGNGYHLASCSEDNTVRIWDLRKKRQLYVIPAHTNNVVTAKFIHNSDIIMTASFDNTIRFWSALDFSPIKSVFGNEGKIMSADISHDFKYIVTANYDRTWRVFMRTRFDSPPNSPAQGMQIEHDVTENGLPDNGNAIENGNGVENGNSVENAMEQ